MPELWAGGVEILPAPTLGVEWAAVAAFLAGNLHPALLCHCGSPGHRGLPGDQCHQAGITNAGDWEKISRRKGPVYKSTVMA